MPTEPDASETDAPSATDGSPQPSDWRDRVASLSERVIPEPLSFAIVLTLLAMIAALLLTDAGPTGVVIAWGDGLSALLGFVAQMALMVLFSHTLAHVGPVPRLLTRLARIPRTERGARWFVCLFTGAVSLIAWPLGLILGGVMVRGVLDALEQRAVRVNQAALAASGFCGYVVWHMGYSASAPLFVATPGNAMEEQIGRLIPASETLLSKWNLIGILVTLAVIGWVATRGAEARRGERDEDELQDPPANLAAPSRRAERWVERLAEARWPTAVAGLLVASYLWLRSGSGAGGLDLNVVNWTFLCFGLLCTRSADEYLQAIGNAGRTVAPLLLLYPLYTGVMGLMLGTGVVALVSERIASVATSETLPLLAFFSGGLINLFVPSGGAQWAVQGPAFIEAAQATGTDIPLIVLSIAYGDQWTNLVHPFVVIPFALIARIEGKRILAGTVLMFLAAGVTLAGTLLAAGILGF